MNVSPGACWSGSLLFEYCFWGNLTHLWIPDWERRDLVTVPRQSGRIHACRLYGHGHHARKPGCGRRNRAECECWRNKSSFSSRRLVYLLRLLWNAALYFWCTLVEGSLVGKKEQVRWWWAGIPAVAVDTGKLTSAWELQPGTASGFTSKSLCRVGDASLLEHNECALL